MPEARRKQPSALERAQTDKARAEVAAAEALVRKLTIEGDEMQYEQDLRKASEWENRRYVFDQGVGAGTVQECMRVLGTWIRRDPAPPVEIVFNSPGGGVIEGLALYDFIQQSRADGTRIDTTALGMAASMGGVLLQAGETRTMSPNSVLLIHEVSSIAAGAMSQVEDEVKFTKSLQQRLLNILAERSTLEADEIKKRWERKDWWLSADEALELGFCDQIR